MKNIVVGRTRKEARKTRNDKKIIQKLLNCALKPTLVRVEILQLLSEAHPNSWSAEKIFHRFLQGGLKGSVATIYRALRDLVDSKLIFKDLSLEGAATYRIRSAEYDEKSITVFGTLSGERFSFADENLRAHLVESLVHAGLIDSEDDISAIQISLTRTPRV